MQPHDVVKAQFSYLSTYATTDESSFPIRSFNNLSTEKPLFFRLFVLEVCADPAQLKFKLVYYPS